MCIHIVFVCMCVGVSVSSCALAKVNKLSPSEICCVYNNAYRKNVDVVPATCLPQRILVRANVLHENL